MLSMAFYDTVTSSIGKTDDTKQRESNELFQGPSTQLQSSVVVN